MSEQFRLKVCVSLLLFAMLYGSTAMAELETGIGFGYAHVPDYIGSDEAEDYLLPLPYIRYRSETLNIDRNAIQGNLWRRGNWSLELSFGGAIRVESEDNAARQGMDDLDFIGEAGPALHYYFRGDRLADNALFLVLPLRSAISTDFTSAQFRGATFNPTLYWRRAYHINNIEVRPQLSAELRSATAAYHDYFYGVDAAFVTEQRRRYNASSGFGGCGFSYSTALVWEQYLLAGFARWINIQQAEFADSPLVKQQHASYFGVAGAYLF